VAMRCNQLSDLAYMAGREIVSDTSNLYQAPSVRTWMGGSFQKSQHLFNMHLSLCGLSLRVIKILQPLPGKPVQAFSNRFRWNPNFRYQFFDSKTVEKTQYDFAPLNSPDTGGSADRDILQSDLRVSSFDDYTDLLSQLLIRQPLFRRLTIFGYQPA
jgi:hypothetical protein